jgi:hypothetical protein
MSARIGLKAVARAAQVSVSTASLALAGNQRVSAATRSRVLFEADRLGYVRDPLIASLAAGRFRHQGKPLVVGCSISATHWQQVFSRQAANMGMSARQVDASSADLAQTLRAMDAAGVVLYERGLDHQRLSRLEVPVVLWEDESPDELLVDVVETTDWWGATHGAIQRVRAAGFADPVLVLLPARPRHWHDDVRLAVARRLGVRLLEWDNTDETLAAFLREARPEVVIGGYAPLRQVLLRLGCDVPFAALLTIDDTWYADVAGWIPDQEHRGQVSLELIEQRLRYGARPPRRIIIPPRWRDGVSLHRR